MQQERLSPVIEIIHLNPHSEKPPNQTVARKLTNIQKLLETKRAITIDNLFLIPSDKKPRILGGKIGEIRVSIRKKILEDQGIQATIDPEITIFNHDQELYNQD